MLCLLSDYCKMAYVINLSVLIRGPALDTTSFPRKASNKVRILCASGFCIPFLFPTSPGLRYITSNKICSGPVSSYSASLTARSEKKFS